MQCKHCTADKACPPSQLLIVCSLTPTATWHFSNLPDCSGVEGDSWYRLRDENRPNIQDVGGDAACPAHLTPWYLPIISLSGYTNM